MDIGRETWLWRKHLPDTLDILGMNRRHFLSVFSLAAGLAGCMTGPRPGNSTADSGDDRSPREPSATETPVDEPSVSVEFRSSYRYGVNDDGIGVLSPERDQFAFVSPPVSDAEPPPSAFRLVLGDEQFSPVSSVPGFRPWVPGIETVYTERIKTGSLLFDVPTAEVDTAALRYDGTSYPLPAAVGDRFATAPAFSLASVSVPDSVTPGEHIELRVTAVNEGDASGTYFAGFRSGGLPKVIDIPAEPGEKGAEAVTYEPNDGSEAMYFDFDYPGGDSQYEVTIESETTDTP